MDFIKDLTIDSLRNAAEDVFNQAKPKSEHEARVYEVLSHKNWGSSSTIMNEIARDTFDYDKFPIITRIMWDSMENQRPAAWRVVFKGLTLLEHLIKNGSEKCVDDARTHAAILRKLFQFNYYEGTVDRGLGVREKSKQLIELLGDDERIREERSKAKQLRERFGGKLGGVGNISSGGGGSQYGGYGNDLNWENRSSGYGESGIGAGGGRSTGATGDRSYGNDSSGGFSGRYSDDSATKASQSSSISNTPTFATIPDEKAKVIKKKKKKKPVEVETTQAPTVPEVDLFSFDAPTAPAPTSGVEFDAFGNSHSKAPFDAFSSAPVQPAAPSNSTFDAFGSTVSGKDQQQAHSFDDFGEFTAAPVAVMGSQVLAPVTTMGQPHMTTVQQNLHFSAYGSRPPNSSAAINQMSNAFGQMNVGFGNVAVSVPSEAIAVSSSAPSTVDDDFGDFSSASQKKPSEVNTDPLSRLIQLDGLSKNQPKISNSGIVGNHHVGNVHSTNPYANANSGFVNTMSTNSALPQAGGATVIGMMSPQMMMTPKPTTMGMTSSGIGMTMNSTLGNQNMQMGSMSFQPQMMMTQHQNGMTHPYVNTAMVGGMTQSSGIMNSPMMQQQQQHQVHQGGVNPQMMTSAMGISGDVSMAGGMMGGNMTGGMMGGQSMQGWR